MRTINLDVRVPGPSEKSGLAPLRALRSAITTFPIILLGIALFITLSLTANHFLSVYNLSNVLYQSALTGILALGLTPVMISGNLDLSVGSALGLSACLVVGLESHGLAVAMTIALMSGVTIGVINGLVVEKIGVNSLIATLAAMVGIQGLTFLYTGNVSLSATSDALLNLGMLSLGPISATAIFFVFCATLFHVVLTRTAQGRNSYAIGGNRTASVEAGIPVGRTVILNFIICGLTASLCGIAMAANLGAATPSLGNNYELWAVTIVVLGGTSLRGGSGSILGTFCAALTLAILRNGLDMLHVPPFYVPIIMGGALISALIIDLNFNEAATSQGE